MIDQVFAIQAGLSGATTAHLLYKAGAIHKTTFNTLRSPIAAGVGLGISSVLTNLNDNFLHVTVAGSAAAGTILANRFLRSLRPKAPKQG